MIKGSIFVSQPLVPDAKNSVMVLVSFMSAMGRNLGVICVRVNDVADEHGIRSGGPHWRRYHVTLFPRIRGSIPAFDEMFGSAALDDDYKYAIYKPSDPEHAPGGDTFAGLTIFNDGELEKEIAANAWSLSHISLGSLLALPVEQRYEAALKGVESAESTG